MRAIWCFEVCPTYFMVVLYWIWVFIHCWCSYLSHKPDNVVYISFKMWYVMLFHFSGLSFSNNTENCLDFVKEEECIWIIIRTRNGKNLNLATPGIWTASPNHFCPFNSALQFLQMTVKSSGLTYRECSNFAGVFPSFFVWTGLWLSSIFVWRANVLIFIAQNADEKSTSFLMCLAQFNVYLS